MGSLAVGFVAGSAVGASAVLLLNPDSASVSPGKSDSSRKRPAAAVGPPPASTLHGQHDALKYGAPSTDQVRYHSGFVSCFDPRTRNPKWVLECLTPDTAARGSAHRAAASFYEEPSLEPHLRSRLTDYARSGYDRGHLVAAANHTSDQEAMDATFSLANVSPQVGDGFNRDYWARLERWVRKAVVPAHRRTWVVTGPLWMPTRAPDGKGGYVMQHPMIGTPPAMVAVPTHFYKVILGETDEEERAIGAFVVPNAPIERDTPLTRFAVGLEDLEAVAGTRFFPGLRGPRAAVDARALQLRASGSDVLASSAPWKQSCVRHLCDSTSCTLPAPWALRKQPAASSGSDKHVGSGSE